MSIGRLERFRLTGSPFGSTVANWGRRGIVKSIQRGTIVLNNVTSNTSTVTAVDPNNAVLHCLGFNGGGASTTLSDFLMAMVLTNGTTITATINTAVAAVHTISYELVEYWPGIIKSLQRGVITSGTSPATATITAVNTVKTLVVYGGATTTGTPTLQGDVLSVYLDLQNSTTVRWTQSNIVGTWTVPYQAVEFY